MIEHFLDNDLYKFTMQQAVLQLYPTVEAEYVFINRGGTVFPDGFAAVLRNKLEGFRGMGLTTRGRAFMGGLFSPSYLDYLSKYRYDPDEVSISQVGGELFLSISGLWSRTILWEVPLMALISELYHEGTTPQPLVDKDFGGAKFADFGTRRRYSQDNHINIVAHAKRHPNFLGTSNVLLAMLNNCKVVGTRVVHVPWCGVWVQEYSCTGSVGRYI